MQYQFCGTLHQEGNRTFIPIPFNVWEETGRKGNIPCRVSILDQCFECKLLPKGSGTYWIPIAKRLLTLLETQAEYEIVLWFDGAFYGAESVDAAKTVSYREIVVSA